jgi:phage recombination protein Bet
MTDQAIALYKPRLPMPPTFNDPGEWAVLVNAIFPSASSTDSVVLALNYCKARKLDPLKKPVHIVTTWDERQGRNVETIWPSIGEHQITASRTGEWAGLEKPVYGPDRTQRFTAYRKVKERGQERWEREDFDLSFPESCSVTVYRIVKGAPRAFTEEVFWLESYARVGRSGAPNAMWRKRPRGQLAKVAKAAALRAAFPEEGAGPTAEEMEGQTLDHAEFVGGEIVGDAAAPSGAEAEAAAADKTWTPPQSPEPPMDPETGEVGPHTVARADEDGQPESWRAWGARFIAGVRTSEKVEEVNQWVERNQTHIDDMREEEPGVYERLAAAINKRRLEIETPEADSPPTQPES